ncbi:MAG TPA: DUF3562 domain-containing protein [Gaiellaceae bacterium]|nr:DUF3562 domain-containing protein [Gaiellaceae bacterium]
MQLTVTAARKIEQLPRYLKHEFPDAPFEAIQHDIEERVHELIVSAHFDDYVPLLVHRTVREHLRAHDSCNGFSCN